VVMIQQVAFIRQSNSLSFRTLRMIKECNSLHSTWRD
jgi:hypothetical protein